jgi:hypothetical protein
MKTPGGNPLADGLTRVARPITSVPSGTNPVSRSASRQATQAFNQSYTNNVAKVQRAFPFNDVSKQVATDRRVNRMVDRELGRIAAAQRNRLEKIYAQKAADTALKNRVAVATRPLVAVGTKLQGAASRLPVKPVLQKIAPAWGLLNKVALPLMVVSSAITIFEFAAPSVQGWLLGGWKQDRRKGVAPPPGIGQSAVPYNLEVWVEIYDFRNGIWVPATYSNRTENVPGPIGGFLTPWQQGNNGFVAVLNPAGEVLRYFGTSYGSAGTYRIAQVSIVRSDGRPEGAASGGTGTAPDPNANIAAPTINPPRGIPQPGTGQGNGGLNDFDKGVLVAAAIAAGLRPNRPNTVTSDHNPGTTPDSFGAPSPGTGTDSTTPKPKPDSESCKGNACGAAGLKQAEANGETLDKLLDLLQKANIAGNTLQLREINEKLGPQYYDTRGNKTGLAGAAVDLYRNVSKGWEYLKLDRVLNVLTFAATVHNASMLSRNLGETLLQAIANVLDVVGIDDADGSPLNLSAMLNSTVENTLKRAIGTENYTELTTAWKKANRIYQATANLLNNIQSLRYSIMGALETIGSWNAKIGNALKKYGVLGDNAYPWMNPSPNFDNRFMRGLETTENFVSQIDSVASEILSAQETVTEIDRQKKELEDAIKLGTEKPGVDNEQQKTKATAATAVSGSPDLNSVDFIKPGS